MKVLCSAREYRIPKGMDGEITDEQCLACARKHLTPPCDMVEPLLRAIYSSQDDRTQEVHVTDVNVCLRKSFLDKTNKQPGRAIDFIPAFVGIAVHKYIASANENSEIEIHLGDAQGRADYVSPEMIVDFKTCKYLSNDRNVKDSETMQLNTYAAALDHPGPLFVQWIDVYGESKNRNGSIRPGTKIGGVNRLQISNEIKRRASLLRSALETGEMPEAEPGWLCKYCNHRDRCPVGEIYMEVENE